MFRPRTVVAASSLAMAVTTCGRETPPREPTPATPGAPEQRDSPSEMPRIEEHGSTTSETAPNAAEGTDVDDGVPDLETLETVSGIDILRSANFASHAHGGAPAQLDEARMNLANRDGKPHRIAVSRVELLNAHCGKEDGWDRRKRLDLRSVDLTIWNASDPLSEHATAIEVPPEARTYQLTVHVKPFTVYQACDRFGFALHLEVDGQDTAIELPLRVKRYNPIRR